MARALVLAALLSVAVLAQEGEEPWEPAFEAAVDAWLMDEDAVALPAMAGLAREGVAPAQIMLTLIDRMPETHDNFLPSLTRDEHAALMRAPSGRSWMSEADVPLAALWREAWRADAAPEVAFAFADLGEARAARVALLAHSARQGWGFAALAADPRYPDSLRYLAWREAPEAAATRAEIAGRHPGDPQLARLDHGAADEAALEEWLLTAEIAAPIGRFCRSVCGEAAGSCARAAFAGIGGYRALLALGPPSETLVSPADWEASLKAIRVLPRRLALLKPPRLDDACLASAVARIP
jgi:hypothetical protein